MPAFVSLIAPGFVDDNEKMKLAIDLTRITFPFLLFISLASFFQQYFSHKDLLRLQLRQFCLILF